MLGSSYSVCWPQQKNCFDCEFRIFFLCFWYLFSQFLLPNFFKNCDKFALFSVQFSHFSHEISRFSRCQSPRHPIQRRVDAFFRIYVQSLWNFLIKILRRNTTRLHRSVCYDWNATFRDEVYDCGARCRTLYVRFVVCTGDWGCYRTLVRNCLQDVCTAVVQWRNQNAHRAWFGFWGRKEQ